MGQASRLRDVAAQGANGNPYDSDSRHGNLWTSAKNITKAGMSYNAGASRARCPGAQRAGAQPMELPP